MPQHRRPRAGVAVVGFIYHQQLKKLWGDVFQPPGQRLHARHLHRLAQVHAAVGSNQPMWHIQAVQCRTRLPQQFSPMHQHADPVTAGCGLTGDVAEQHRLAAASRQYEQHGPMPLPVRLANLLNSLGLVWPQHGRGHGRLLAKAS